jgi:hypothetical protein
MQVFVAPQPRCPGGARLPTGVRTSQWRVIERNP